MSWNCSLVLVEEFSAASCVDIDACARLKSIRTADKFSWLDKKTVRSRRSRSGMMSEPSMASLGVERWMSSLAVSRARTLVALAKEPELAAQSPASGARWRESSVRYDRDTSSWKTHLCLSSEALPWSSVTLPKWGMTRDGVCWERIMSGHHTRGTDCGSSPVWRSPSAREPGITTQRLETRTGEPVGSMCRHYDKITGRMAQIGLSQQVECFPTPTAACASGGQTSRSGDRKGELLLAGYAKKFPTPQAHDGNGPPGAGTRTSGGRHSDIQCAVGGKLNQTWVEWLMGWPLGHTDLEPLETDKYRSWLQLHGGC
jgi:hypothetical protein